MKTQFTTIPGGHHCLPASNATGAAHAAKSGMFDALKTLKKLFGGSAFSPLRGCSLWQPWRRLAPIRWMPASPTGPATPVRVIVTFKEPVSLRYALARFGLQGQLPAAQKVFTSIVDANSYTKLSDHEYELTGKIGEHVATGTYQLSFINATDDADFTRNFTAPQDLPVVTIAVRNDRCVEFPDITAVKVSPPAASLRISQRKRADRTSLGSQTREATVPRI